MKRNRSVAFVRPVAVRRAAVLLLAAAASLALAPAAQARNVRSMQSLADALHDSRAHEILGNLELRFGGGSAARRDIVSRDIVVTGTGSTRLDDPNVHDSLRPTDRELCMRAFEDALTKLVFDARDAHATAILGIVSDYENHVFDDPDHFECHSGALRAYVTLRAQLVRGPMDAPMPVVVPTPMPMPPDPAPVDPAPAPHFVPEYSPPSQPQPLPGDPPSPPPAQ